MPQFHFSLFYVVTKLMQTLYQGNYVLPGLIINTYNTLDMPVVLTGTYKNPLVTEKAEIG